VIECLSATLSEVTKWLEAAQPLAALIGQLKARKLNFTLFPADPARRRKWIQALRREKFEPSASHVLCSEHFLPSDYVEHSDMLSIVSLKKTSVPSLFKGFPSHLQPKEGVKKRRVLPDWHPPPLSPPPLHEPLPLPPPDTIVKLDHTYSFPSSIEEAKVKCDKLQHALEGKLVKEAAQRRRFSL
jgi:hypothetical protein